MIFVFRFDFSFLYAREIGQVIHIKRAELAGDCI